MNKTIKHISLVVLSLVLLGACKKDYLDTTPTDNVNEETVFKSTEGAMVALNGTYRWMYTYITNHSNFGQKSIDLVLDLMGNDMVVHSAGYRWFNPDYDYTAAQSPVKDAHPERFWYYYYQIINNVNRILAHLDAATGTQEDKDYIKGQALALRAHSYFYLINFWQHTYKGHENAPGVPLYTTPSTEGKPRGTLQQVYDQINADLTEAETLLTGKSRQHISHIGIEVVQGIHARVALQQENYAAAADYAHKARQDYSLMSKADYTAGFGAINGEWMWGLEVISEQATVYASFFSHIDPTAGGYASLGTQKKITKALYDQISDDDLRKQLFITPGSGTSSLPDYTTMKFRLPVPGSWQGDYLLMRAGEMYLIEAEGLARTGKTAAAQQLLNELVQPKYPAYNATQAGTDLVNEILLQRRIELWGEGFALLDIKRLKQSLNRPQGPGNHQLALAGLFALPAEDPKFLYKVPQDELNNNHALSIADQNP